MPYKKDKHTNRDHLNMLKHDDTVLSDQDPAFDKLTELAAHVCNTPMALILLVDKDRRRIKSTVGFDQAAISDSLTLFEDTIQQSSFLEIKDLLTEDGFKHNPVVISGTDIRYYAGVPLLNKGGKTVGVLCVMHPNPHSINDVQQTTLKLIGEAILELIVKFQVKQDMMRFERLFTQSHDLICLMDSEGVVKRYNPAFSQLLSWGTTSPHSQHFNDLIHPADLITAMEILKMAEGAPSYTFTSLCKTTKQEEIIIEWVITREEGSDDRLVIGRDITSERKRELILAESENKFRSFFENSQGLMCIHDTDGNFMSVNSAGAGLLGYSVAEVLQMSLFDLVDTHYHKQLKLYLKTVVQRKKAHGILNFMHKNGTSNIWMFNNIYEHTPDGNGYIIGNAIDITERHKLEHDLKHTQAMLEEINRIARIGGWEVDIEKSVPFWSDITKDIHEVPHDYVPDLETAINFYKEGESRERIRMRVERGLKEGIGWDEELQIITAKGNEKWVRAIGRVEFTNGKCTRLYGTFQDIDEKKKAAIEISNSRKQLHDLLQSASEVSIIATGMDGVIKVFNRGAENMLGYEASDMIDKQTPMILHDTLEIKTREIELTEEYQTPITGKLVFSYKPQLHGSEKREWTYIRKDGSRIIVSLVMSCIRDIDGVIVGFLGIATDITASKEAQAEISYEKTRLQLFVEHAPAAVAMLDKDLRYIAVSNRWLEENKMGNKNLIGLLHYDVVPNISDAWKLTHQRCLAGEVIKCDEDIWRPLGWDHDQYINWEIRPWYLFDGTVGGIMMFTQDITELSLQRKELHLAKKMAEQASIAKSEFLANMSHEIRTPLNGVIGFTDLLLKTDVNETQKQYLSIVNHSGNALLNIINDILDFSKIEAGKLDLDIDKCDLYDLGSQVADIVSFQAQSKDLELLLNISTDLPRFIWADDIRLKQVLINLLSNATKFTEYGEIELKIHPIEEATNQNDSLMIRFEVRDTGIGIKPENQGKIFEAFLQEDASTTKKYGGTGLGLTISNKLLNLMGSSLQLQSEYGKGSTFFFDLKLKVEQGVQINWEGIEKIKHVLIVDDNDNNRLILRQMLLLKQITCDEVKNGIEALSILSMSHKKYDVIFMDYHMPIMDGIETIRKIRQSFFSSPKDQPIILLSSSSTDEAVMKDCEELKVNYRIVKPMKMQEMYNTLSHLTQHESLPVVETVKPDLATSASSTGTVNVLLVEDNHFNMLLASSIIKRLLPNVNLIEIENGKDAITYCQNNIPDIIFMDIQMPKMNGYETTTEIRKIAAQKQTPIIALTAGNLKGERERCAEVGMNDFLAKPIVERMVAEMLDKWIHKLHTPPVFESPIPAGDKKRFDLSALRELSANDEDFLKEVLTVAKRDLMTFPVSMKEAYESGDIATLKLKAHSLKSVALSLGAADIAASAASIEYAEEIVQDDIIATLVYLQSEIDQILPLISEQINS